ncbi:hypothetical protein [Cupriavidus sp. a3]|uniref:hypothetical protein n=1 Tax=Cupriavidus sp. a3 TaxID=3242158 RepID=UPI003D9C4EAC
MLKRLPTYDIATARQHCSGMRPVSATAMGQGPETLRWSQRFYLHSVATART